MQIKQILAAIEAFAPLSLQDDFDNSGLQVGDASQSVRGILLCLDVTPEVLDEAVELGCNLVISHHPLLFRPLRSLTGQTAVERCVIQACRHDVVVYAAHTNLDNALGGVNFTLAEKIGLQNIGFLKPGEAGGAGAIGELPAPESEESFLERIKGIFRLQTLSHSPLMGRPVQAIALCGGSGAFLIPTALSAGADVFLTGEVHYHDYYAVEDRMLLAVLGHYETEHHTKALFFDIISKKIPTFATHFSNVDTNPVNYR